MFTIAESYYKCKEYDKANLIVEKYLKICDDYLTYYLGQDKNYIRNISNEIQYNLQILRNLLITSQLYEQEDIAIKAENIFNIHYQNYSSKVVR